MSWSVIARPRGYAPNVGQGALNGLRWAVANARGLGPTHRGSVSDRDALTWAASQDDDVLRKCRNVGPTRLRWIRDAIILNADLGLIPAGTPAGDRARLAVTLGPDLYHSRVAVGGKLLPCRAIAVELEPDTKGVLVLRVPLEYIDLEVRP